MVGGARGKDGGSCCCRFACGEGLFWRRDSLALTYSYFIRRYILRFANDFSASKPRRIKQKTKKCDSQIFLKIRKRGGNTTRSTERGRRRPICVEATKGIHGLDSRFFVPRVCLGGCLAGLVLEYLVYRPSALHGVGFVESEAHF